MINIELIKHCLTCPNIDIRASVDRVYANEGVVSASGKIECIHKNVCEDYKKLSKYDFTISEIINVVD